MADIQPSQLPPEGFSRLWGKVAGKGNSTERSPFPQQDLNPQTREFSKAVAQRIPRDGGKQPPIPPCLACSLPPPPPPPPRCSSRLCCWFFLPAETGCSQGGQPHGILDMGTWVGCGEAREMLAGAAEEEPCQEARRPRDEDIPVRGDVLLMEKVPEPDHGRFLQPHSMHRSISKNVPAPRARAFLDFCVEPQVVLRYL